MPQLTLEGRRVSGRATALILRDAALAVLTTLLTLLVFEVGIRMAGAIFTPSFFTTEGERGYAYRPNGEGWAESNHVYERFNSLGYHDRERSLAKPIGVLRIAVVGSSYVAADQVALKDNFCSVLERALNSSTRNRPKVEVLNFGQAAYSPVQSYYTLNKDVWQFRPDIVIFMITNIDLLDTSRATAFNRWSFRPFFELDPNGKIVRDQQSRSVSPPNPAQVEAENRRNNLMNRSELALAVVNAYRHAQSKWDPTPPEPLDHYRRPGVDWVNFFTFTPPPQNGPMENNWRILATLMSQIRRDAHEHSAEVWIIPIGTAEQEYPDPRFRQKFRKEVGISDPYYWDRRVDTIAEANGFHYLDLPPLLAAYATEHNVILHGFPYGPLDGHWNERGHDAAGHLAASELLNSSRVFKNPEQPETQAR